MDYKKYRAFPTVNLKGRKWPGNIIEKAPFWCSVDLRDGNQALIRPMNLEKKIEFFKFLVSLGFKEIEIGFPAASDTEFIFTRALIEQGLIPDDVTIQVLTQSREHIIKKTFEALDGAKKSIVHLYNSTSTLQRDVVFNKNKDEIKEIALFGARMIVDLAKQFGRGNYIFEYSPESFTGTELGYAAEVCNAVIEVFEPSPDKKVIINLPATVEMSTPNVYADQIEYMCNNLINRENVIVSLHAHNDRGTAVAATELALMAGADRVEGTIFGNGERTGNADILSIALNLYSQGVDPNLDFSNMDEVVRMYEDATNLAVHPRHPYAGELVYTAFSGSHQDAIKKGMQRVSGQQHWEVPYLPVDPKDFGRSYGPIIRINSQSGKGGVSYILEQNNGIIMPKAMQADFGRIITDISDSTDKELLPEEIYNIFRKTYVNYEATLALSSYNEVTNGESMLACMYSAGNKCSTALHADLLY
jgi:2-isopropylmalate synthase